MAALELSQASKKSFILFVIFKLFMLLLFTLETTWGFVRRKDNRVLVYWNQMLNSDFCQDQAFIFSTADTVTDPSHLQEFIATRQRKADSNISVLKLEDSAHVQHLRKHPNFYTHFVNTFVSELLEQPII